MIDGEQINGSDEIVNKLLESESVQAVLRSKGSFDFEAHPKWSTFAHEDLASLLYPNLCRSLGNSYEAFGYVNTVDEFSSLQKFSIRTIGSFAMYMAASKIKCE